MAQVKSGRVQFRHSEVDVWKWLGPDERFNWEEAATYAIQLRIAPEPTLRAWKYGEAPRDAIYRSKRWAASEWRRVNGGSTNGLLFMGAGYVSFDEMFEDWIHSTDSGATWKVCGVEDGQ